jgi:hypothetical protein
MERQHSGSCQYCARTSVARALAPCGKVAEVGASWARVCLLPPEHSGPHQYRMLSEDPEAGGWPNDLKGKDL